MVSSQLIDFGAMGWADLLPGVKAKRVWADPGSGGGPSRVAMFIRFAADTALPRHAHAGDELVYVLEGVLADDHGAITAGNVGYRPDGCLHTVRSPTGATVFAVITGSIDPKQDGDTGGPPSQVFDLAAMPWTETRPGLWQKVFWRDEAAGRSAALNRFDPGTELAAHRHNGDELVFAIEGTVDDEAGSVRPGVVGYRPDGCAHTVRTPNGALALGYLWGGVEAL